ncbi:hypothetical protein [Paenibacillus selenitireducens]|uniref:hypothetical protein n=1 Tax=Paenibacillus selenitireducens TaxID=1324314 RepID=UPI001301BD5E|nr:hypothetical protein [Paenibacillus selenitireducens]
MDIFWLFFIIFVVVVGAGHLGNQSVMIKKLEGIQKEIAELNAKLPNQKDQEG